MRIRSRLAILGVNPYVSISPSEASRLKKDWRGPIPVRYRVGGGPDRTWRINMMPLGDRSYRLYMNGEVREASNLRVGDDLVLLIEFDDEYKGGPEHPMPSWFHDELSRSPLALQGWGSLPPSRRKEIIRYFVRLKSEPARRRNTEKALRVLSGGAGRFMARDWNADAVTERRRKGGRQGAL